MKHEKFAPLLLAHIRKHNVEKQAPITRAELNQDMRKSTNEDQLSLVLLNLLHHGYLHKRLVDTAVSFWVTPKVEPTLCLELDPDKLVERAVGQDLIQAADSADEPLTPAELSSQLEQQPTVESRCPLDVYAIRRFRTAQARNTAVYDFIAQRPNWPSVDLEQAICQKLRPVVVTRAIDALFHQGLISAQTVNGQLCYVPVTKSVVTFPPPVSSAEVQADEPIADEPLAEQPATIDAALASLPPAVRQSIVSLVNSLVKEYADAV